MKDRLTQMMVCFTFLAAVALFTMGPYSGGSGGSGTNSLVWTSTSDGVVVGGACAVTGLMIMTDGSNNATVELENGSGGTVQSKFTVLAADYYGGRNWVYPLYFDSDGCYMDVTSDGTATVWVEYIKQ